MPASSPCEKRPRDDGEHDAGDRAESLPEPPLNDRPEEEFLGRRSDQEENDEDDRSEHRVRYRRMPG